MKKLPHYILIARSLAPFYIKTRHYRKNIKERKDKISSIIRVQNIDKDLKTEIVSCIVFLFVTFRGLKVTKKVQINDILIINAVNHFVRIFVTVWNNNCYL